MGDNYLPASTDAFYRDLNSPDTDRNWMSPAHVDDSLEQLVTIPATYLDDVDRIADVGCGDRTLTYALADEYPDTAIWGVDEHLPAPDYETYDHLTLVEDNALEQLPEQNPFDVIYAVNTVQAMDDPKTAAEALYDAVDTDGYVAATLPVAAEDADNLLPEDCIRYDDDVDAQRIVFEDGHTDGDRIHFEQYKFSPERAESLFTDAGFTIEEQDELVIDTAILPDLFGILDADMPDTPSTGQATTNLYILSAE